MKSYTLSLSYLSYIYVPICFPVLQKENQEISPQRDRRNSDSSLHAIRSNEKLVVVTQREQIKHYQERIRALEEEIEKMRAQGKQ